MERPLSATNGNAQGAPILIVGASVRSAAHSAVRAGLQPICADCFADKDLQTVADARPVENYPDDLPRLAGDVPHCPWMYTGALENHPRIIAEISRHRPLWGNPAEVVRKIRDPFRLVEILRASGLPAVDLCRSSRPPEPDGRWMLKPINGSAGRGIRIWDESAAGSTTLDEPHYFQQRQTGQPLSALFIASNHDCRLIGVARQLIGNADLHASPFTFCGAIAPIDPGHFVRDRIREYGGVLARTYGLRGLFGIDFLCDAHQLWLMEVNPRYTATVELFEHAFSIPLLEEHRRACQDATGPTPPHSDFPDRADRLIAKAILFADQRRIIPAVVEQFAAATPTAPLALPTIADIPSPGTRIPTGHPICTLFAAGQTERECLRALHHRTRAVQQTLTETQVSRP